MSKLKKDLKTMRKQVRRNIRVYEATGLLPTPSAILEILRDKKGHIIRILPIPRDMFDTIYPAASKPYKYVQVIDGIPVSAFTEDELLVIP